MPPTTPPDTRPCEFPVRLTSAIMTTRPCHPSEGASLKLRTKLLLRFWCKRWLTITHSCRRKSSGQPERKKLSLKFWCLTTKRFWTNEVAMSLSTDRTLPCDETPRSASTAGSHSRGSRSRYGSSIYDRDFHVSLFSGAGYTTKVFWRLLR